MKDEEERAIRRALEAGGVEERAAFLSGLISSAAPCKACSGAGEAACHHDPRSTRLCTPCLGTGLAMDEGRLKLAAWLGDDAAALAMSCGWCGGSRVVENRPTAVNATASSSAFVYPDGSRPASAGCAYVTITKVWPEYRPCRWCSRAEPEWRAGTFADAAYHRALMALEDDPEAVRVAAVGSCLGLLRSAGHVGLPDAWNALMDWTICPCGPRALAVSGHLADFRDALRIVNEPPQHVLAVVDVLEASTGGQDNPFLVLASIVARGVADDAAAIRAACGTLARMCMGATWD